MEYPDTQTLQQLDAAHHLHPFNDNAALAQKGTRILTRGEGCYVWDAEGNQLLDAFAGLWCVNIGYGRTEIAEVAAEQMKELPFYNTFFKTATPPTVMLAAKIAALTGNRLLFEDGLPVALLAGGEVQLLVERSPADEWELRLALLGRTPRPDRQAPAPAPRALRGGKRPAASDPPRLH